jgi:hypothetical protein
MRVVDVNHQTAPPRGGVDQDGAEQETRQHFARPDIRGAQMRAQHDVVDIIGVVDKHHDAESPVGRRCIEFLES